MGMNGVGTVVACLTKDGKTIHNPQVAGSRNIIYLELCLEFSLLDMFEDLRMKAENS